METITLKMLINGYQRLSTKEKKALMICSFSVFFFVLYQFIYLPFQNNSKKLQTQQHYQTELHQWFIKIKPLINASSSSKKSLNINPAQLLSVTSDSLKSTLGTQPYELGQSDSNSVQLTIKEISYQHFMRWFEPFFKKTPQLNIKELVINALNAPGMVSISLRFELK